MKVICFAIKKFYYASIKLSSFDAVNKIFSRSYLLKKRSFHRIALEYKAYMYQGASPFFSLLLPGSQLLVDYGIFIWQQYGNKTCLCYTLKWYM